MAHFANKVFLFYPFLRQVIDLLKADVNDQPFSEEKLVISFDGNNIKAVAYGAIHRLAFQSPCIIKTTLPTLRSALYGYMKIFAVFERGQSFEVLEIGAEGKYFDPATEIFGWTGPPVWLYLKDRGMPDPQYFVVCSRDSNDERKLRTLTMYSGESPMRISETISEEVYLKDFKGASVPA